MKKYLAPILFVCSLFSMFFINIDAVAASSTKYPPAPIDKIMAKQRGSKTEIQQYTASIVHSYTLYPEELNEILQNEYQTLNLETRRMQQIRKNWNSTSFAYRFLNYKLNEQISQEITQTRKKFAARKQKFADFIKKAPQNRKIYIIESTDPLFFYSSISDKVSKARKSGIQMSFSQHGIHYLSLFDKDYRHIFTYHRQHVDMLENRRFMIEKTRNKQVNHSYQKIFDDYLTDLKKIGSGVDMTNRTMLRQISEMKDEYRSE
ncbi:MAG: hypothetical protein IJ770_04010 [Alphaproteobacteria bacterium]|nr:hypothetical protein [Alphaproteobacteria bacterium]